MRVFLALLALIAVWPLAAFALPAHPAPAKPTQTPAAACRANRWPELSPTLTLDRSKSVVSATSILAMDQEDNVDITGLPAASDPSHVLTFRLFIADVRSQDPRSSAVDDPNGLTVTQSSHRSAAVATDLNIADPTQAFNLAFYPPSVKGAAPWRWVTLVVVACDDTGVAAWGAAPIRESRELPSLVASLAVVVGLYIFTAFMLRNVRNRAIAQAIRDKDDKVKYPPPRTLITLRSWSLLECLNPVAMTSDEFDQGSLSNLQILFFTGLVVYGLSDWVLRSGAVSDLSPSIIYLLGIPALGTLGNGVAKATRDRLNVDNWAWLVNRGVLPVNDPGAESAAGGPKWSDLIMTGSVLDVPKLQALTFSLIVGIGMLTSGFSHLSGFQLPQSMLEILGLSQAVFVGGRFVKPATVGDIDNAITELRARYAALIQAAASGKDVGPDGKPTTAGASAGAPFRSMAAAGGIAAVPNAVQRYRETEEQVTLLLNSLLHRHVDTTRLADPLTPLA
jgi:hypothetical protein